MKDTRLLDKFNEAKKYYVSMIDYKTSKDYDMHYCNLTHKYEISRIVREDKGTRRAEVIYWSRSAQDREKAGIEKILLGAGIAVREALVSTILRLNTIFGKYHTLEMLADRDSLLDQCGNEQDEVVVNRFLEEWGKIYDAVDE